MTDETGPFIVSESGVLAFPDLLSSDFDTDFDDKGSCNFLWLT